MFRISFILVCDAIKMGWNVCELVLVIEGPSFWGDSFQLLVFTILESDLCLRIQLPFHEGPVERPHYKQFVCVKLKFANAWTRWTGSKPHTLVQRVCDPWKLATEPGASAFGTMATTSQNSTQLYRGPDLIEPWSQSPKQEHCSWTSWQGARDPHLDWLASSAQVRVGPPPPGSCTGCGWSASCIAGRGASRLKKTCEMDKD